MLSYLPVPIYNTPTKSLIFIEQLYLLQIRNMSFLQGVQLESSWEVTE